jgi:1,4-dihydroxy-6-naphthoate synthase
MKFTLGFSPCPNDTFIFDALVNQKIDTKGISFDYVMEDVECLNKKALHNELDITKLSYSAYLRCIKEYALLKSGSALGKGVGPLLISKKDIDFSSIEDCSIAIPGEFTTANLLLQLAAPNATNKTPILFSEIEQQILNDTFDVGLIIHESRFTYAQKGLKKIIDLGEWWETNFNCAIPLGGIVIKRSIPREVALLIDSLILESIEYSWKNYPTLSQFVINNAQEMDPEVMLQHINLYVNSYTKSLGESGTTSIQTMITKAIEAKMIEPLNFESLFY